MTVRWKPLLVLSGLFAVIAVVGVCAMAYALVPRRSSDILPSARAYRAARQYDKAEVDYKRALQLDGKNAAIHEEMAAMYAEWAGRAASEKQAKIRGSRLAALVEATKHGKALKNPRRELLAAAMAQDEVPEGLHWAKELLALEPADPDALYEVASEALEDRSPSVPEGKRNLAALEAARAPEVRVLWVKARLAQLTGDAATREAVLAKARTLRLPDGANPVDRMALLRLRALDVETAGDPSSLPGRVKAMRAEARVLADGSEVPPNRIMRLNLLLERVQRALSLAASKADPATRAAVNGLLDAIDQDVESIFQRSLAAASKTDLNVYFTYADHLRFRGQRERCLEVVDQAMKSPQAALATSNETVMGLHAVAVEAALGDAKDAKRFDKAAPHIKDLIASTSPRFQGLGHLFQGAIDLEQSGVAGVSPAANGAAAPAEPAVRPKLRASALNHLKLAAAQLPDIVEAQARYGVALVLSQELALGRQYLQSAMRLGGAEPQYQVWAAWSIVQAGYPEEAEPIVNHLMGEIAQGRMSRDLEGTLHLLNGEIHQARRSPDDLKRALAEYDRSYAGKTAPAAVQLRMAQIDVQLGQSARALQRIEGLRARGQGAVAAEHLAVLILIEQGKKADALGTLSKARARFPDSDELVGLEAALLSKDEKPKEADRVLAEFLARNPDNVSVALMRAQVQAEQLDNAKEARRLLLDVADRSENSAPLVQLALLDLRQKDYEAVSATIAKIRARWKEAAAADLLDAQLALEQGNLPEAVSSFDAALKKDPGNKLVQFWKAQIDSRMGASAEATQAFEALAKDGSSKRLDSGLSLPDAARSALANLALQSGNVDEAIRKFESLRAGDGLGGLARGDRWQLVAAYASRDQWPAAHKEIAALINDKVNPPTLDERVRAANFYRLHKEDGAAVAQLDYVLSVNPAHPAAVVTRAYMLSESKKLPEAIALVRKAIAAPAKGQARPPALFYLMLAALENVSPPEADASKRAMTALDQGLDAQPRAPELLQAKYRLLLATDGPKAAVAFVEAEAKGDPQGNVLRMLADVYRDQQDFENAEKTLAELVAKNPKNPTLAASLVRVTALRAGRAAERNDHDGERALNETTSARIREFRAKFPNDLAFLQEECDLAFRRGDLARATAITKEIDQVAKTSPAGPLLRARLFAAQNRPRDAADAYNEALRRNPMQPDVRLALAQTDLKLGEVDEAVRQAKLVQESDPNRADALLLETRALARPTADPSQTAARQAQALERLSSAIKRQPKLSAAYHQVAEIRLAQNRPGDAVAALRAGLDAVPDDAFGLAQLVELLARPGGADLPAANALAKTVGDRDTKGNLTLALAVGFHKAGQLALAETWAARAAAKLDAPVVHLNYGDILLSMAERRDQPAEAKTYFQRAVEQYDLVLKAQSNQVEAVNNKAWILHTYLGESRKALDLAQGLLARVDPAMLPGEFFDTLGAIQESLGQARDAEESYSKGLRKAPDHPVLNYHMGKLIVGDRRRTEKAKGYLEKAFAGRDRMAPTMAAEVASLWEKVRAH